MLLLLWVAAVISVGTPIAHAKYVLHVVADDLGYDDVGWRNGQTLTPNLDSLVHNGVEIPEFYTYMMCAPARGATMSGRYPMRLGVYIANLAEWDLDKAKLLPAVLKEGTSDRMWATHALGKWHVGWYYRNYTPTFRGFDTFLGSSGNYGGGGGYWDHTLAGAGRCGTSQHTFAKDFIEAKGETLTLADPSLFGVYDTEVLSARAVSIVSDHELSHGLYLYLAFHNVHDPQNAPLETVQQYPHTRWDGRKVSNAMLTELDSGLGNVTAVMRERGMWNDTLIIFHTDNGGPSDHACNHPLRGAKFGFWEGGVKGVAFVSGGAIPPAVRGTQFNGLAHVTDWYSTVAAFGGVTLPSNTGTASLDSVNLWEAISGGTASPRTEVLHMPNSTVIQPDAACALGADKGCSPAIRVGKFKLIVGWPGFDEVCTDSPPSPTVIPFGQSGGSLSQGTHCSGGEWNPTWTNGTLNCIPHCLFDVVSDPSESHDLSKEPAYAQTLETLQNRLYQLAEGGAPSPTIQQITRDGKDLNPQMCAIYNRTGFWLPVDWFADSPDDPKGPMWQ